MTAGAISDEIPSNLKEQLLLQDAKSGNCRPIQVGADKLLGDAPANLL